MRQIAALVLLFAAPPVALQIVDERGKRPGGVVIDAANPDPDGWLQLTIAKSKVPSVIVWPFDQRAKQPDGPEPVTVIAVAKGNPKLLESRKVVAALAVPMLLGTKPVETGLDAAALERAIGGLTASDDDLEKGIGLLFSHKAPDAVPALALALRARERVMTRIPSEIYPAAMLYGIALFQINKFDDAAVSFRKAILVRPSDARARKWRADAFEKAGKPEVDPRMLQIRP